MNGCHKEALHNDTGNCQSHYPGSPPFLLCLGTLVSDEALTLLIGLSAIVLMAINMQYQTIVERLRQRIAYLESYHDRSDLLGNEPSD